MSLLAAVKHQPVLTREMIGLLRGIADRLRIGHDPKAVATDLEQAANDLQLALEVASPGGKHPS